MKLEEKLISLRKEKGLSQMKLAEMMNVSRQAISRWEVGAAVPSTDNVRPVKHHTWARKENKNEKENAIFAVMLCNVFEPQFTCYGNRYCI